MRKPVTDILACDPRPHYHDDPARVYAVQYDRFEVHFTVSDNNAVVSSVMLNKVKAETI